MDPEKPIIAAADHAYLSIRSDIISGALAESERLNGERLSANLGLSRTPGSAALRRLTLEGFIERQSGNTTRVARFPADEMEQIFHICRCLNPMPPNAPSRWAAAYLLIPWAQAKAGGFSLPALRTVRPLLSARAQVLPLSAPETSPCWPGSRSDPFREGDQ